MAMAMAMVAMSMFAESDKGNGESKSDVSCIAASITNWVDRYRASPEFKIERGGTNTYIRGTVGIFPSLFSKYDIVIDLDTEEQEAYCYGYLPTKVSAERRADMVEFIFRAECAYGLSPATLVLDDDGMVRCQSWLPFAELERSPGRVLPRLVGSVMEKLYACSQAVGPVLLGTGKPDCASRVRPVGLFGEEYESPSSSNAADADKILKACFSDNQWTTDKESGDWIARRFAGEDGGASFIRAWFTDLKKDIGCACDRLDYTLVVKNGTVCNVCPLPIDVPRDRIADVADAAMHLNQSLKYAFFCVDFDNSKLWCGYSLPVSALQCDGGTNVTNRYRLHIKATAISGVARNLERLSETMSKRPQAGDSDDGEKPHAKVSDDGNSVTIPLDDGIALLEKIAHGTATGGMPLAKSDEPLALRYSNATQAYFDSKAGLSRSEKKIFPKLKPVKKTTGIKLNFAESFEIAAKGKVAQFPDGEIRWTEDGTNGLSIAESTIKMREAQIESVKRLMHGRETANEPGTVWILNDDFIFGYGSGIDKRNEDAITYVFMIRHEMDEAPAGMCVLLDFAPTQAISDSITGAFLGDEAARENLKALQSAGLVKVVTEE